MSDAGARRGDVYAIGKKNPNLPFHPAVRAGDFIFVSGQVAKDTDGNMIAGTIEDETRGTIEAIRRILAEEGATLADVVRVTTYLGDTRDFGRYNKVFAEHFRDAVLARTEMEAIAYKPRGE
jgi:enamine deaminase RidA (YjgF/YER057c/UK114 family)